MKRLFALILFVSINSSASETRIIEALPTSGDTSASALIKEKQAGFQCQWAKLADSGNLNKAKGSKTYWFKKSAVPEVTQAQETKISGLIADGKKVLKCTLKEYSTEKNRMANADLD
jgi:hypothetical protein